MAILRFNTNPEDNCPTSDSELIDFLHQYSLKHSIWLGSVEQESILYELQKMILYFRERNKNPDAVCQDKIVSFQFSDIQYSNLCGRHFAEILEKWFGMNCVLSINGHDFCTRASEWKIRVRQMPFFLIYDCKSDEIDRIKEISSGFSSGRTPAVIICAAASEIISVETTKPPTPPDTAESIPLPVIALQQTEEFSEFPADAVLTQKRNVLILNLSTINSMKGLTLSTYTIRQNGDFFVNPQSSFDLSQTWYGHQQQEPIPKLLIDYFESCIFKQTLDEILIFASKESLVRDTFPYMETNTSEKILYECSAQSYLIHSLQEYISEKQDYKNHPILFKTILIDEEKPGKAVLEAVTHLRNLRIMNEKLDLFIDIHGGFREFNTIVLALASLLKNDGLEIPSENILTVNYKNNSGQITGAGPAFNIFDFVSGINEFLNYGKAESLKRYLKSTPASGDHQLVTAIDLIAEGIQLCDMNRFDDGIEEMKAVLSHPAEDLYLQTVISLFKNDYGPLLEKHTIVDEIDWCLKKGFIQQALTILETRMPDEFVKNGLRYYCKEGDPVDKKCDQLEQCIAFANPKKYMTENLNHYFIKYYDKDYWKCKDVVDKIIPRTLCPMGDKVNSLIDDQYIKGICEFRNNANHASSHNQRKTAAEIIELIQEFMANFKELSDMIPDEKKAAIIQFLNADGHVHRKYNIDPSQWKSIPVSELEDQNGVYMDLLKETIQKLILLYRIKKYPGDLVEWDLIKKDYCILYDQAFPTKKELYHNPQNAGSPIVLVVRHPQFEKVTFPDKSGPFLRFKPE